MIAIGLTWDRGLMAAIWLRQPASHFSFLAVDGVTPASSQTSIFHTTIDAIILGLVQGITEFLPISSTAHLLIVTRLLGWQSLGEKYFVDAIQFGSVIAVLLYFWFDLN